MSSTAVHPYAVQYNPSRGDVEFLNAVRARELRLRVAPAIVSSQDPANEKFKQCKHVFFVPFGTSGPEEVKKK